MFLVSKVCVLGESCACIPRELILCESCVLGDHTHMLCKSYVLMVSHVYALGAPHTCSSKIIQVC